MTGTRRGAAALGVATALTLISCGSPDAADGPDNPNDTHTSVAVTGTVRAAPACPIEGADQSCLRAPVDGALVEVIQAGNAIDSTHTDSQGRFRLSGAPGVLTIRATTTHGVPSKATQKITLTAGTESRLRLLLDTKIRNPLTAP